MDSMIAQIVGRCHVGESNRTVIKYVISRLKKGAWRHKMTRKERRTLMRAAIKEHQKNRELYAYVMRGEPWAAPDK